uniref:Transmembrane protein n=1 Tax=Medicago truncatula TaxID=3880 RepID=I3T797_MEDTR|nr:unknown [Medicago truncatula]
MNLSELIMVIIIFIFIIVENSTIKYIWILDHLRQSEPPIFVNVCL